MNISGIFEYWRTLLEGRAELPYGILALEGDVAHALPWVPRVVEGKHHRGDSAVPGESLQNFAVGQIGEIKLGPNLDPSVDEDRSLKVLPRLFHVYFLVVDEVLFLG